MGSSRRLALLATRAWTAARPRSELASGAVAARARGFAAVPATNDDDYKRLKAAKSSITVRAQRRGRVARRASCALRSPPPPHVRSAAVRLTRGAPLPRRSGLRCATSRWRPWTPRWRAIAARWRARTRVAPDAWRQPGRYHRAREEPAVEGAQRTRVASPWCRAVADGAGGRCLALQHPQLTRAAPCRASSSSRPRTSCPPPCLRRSAPSWCASRRAALQHRGTAACASASASR